MFRTRHGEPVMKIMAAYPPGEVLAMALEAYIQAQVEAAELRAKEENVPVGVCEGLHSGPPRGLVCRACYDAERGAQMLVQVESEMEMARERRNG
jgi:hypothetical protein